MTSNRPYRSAIDHAGAVRELWSCSGTQFDPAVVSAFVRALAGPARVGRAEDELVNQRALRASAQAIS